MSKTNVISINKSPIEWIEKYAVDPLSDQKVTLLDWQKDLINNMYSPTGAIKKPNWYAFGSKKTGKSALAAMLAAYRMCHNTRELYCVIASNESQAYVIYRSFIELFEYAPFFKGLKVLKNQIIHKQNKTELRILTRAVSSSHGLRVNLLLCDEVMAWDEKNFNQLSTLEASMTLSKNPQKFFLSNVPLFPDHPSLELLKQYKKDNEWQITEFKATDPDKWKSPEQWQIANPMLKAFPQVKKNYENDFKRALVDKNAEVTFKRYNLGLGTSMDSDRWIDPEKLNWIEDQAEIEKVFKNEDLVWTCGFDLSLQGADSTSWVLAGMQPASNDDPLTDSKLYLYGKIYYGNIQNKKALLRDKIKVWNRTGEVTWQRGDCIEPEPILNDFYSTLEKYPQITRDLICVFDPAYSLPYRQELNLGGIKSKVTSYSPKFMTEPIRRMQRLAELKSIYILEKQNEAIKWQAGCGVVNSLSRNWCMLNRMNKNNQLNVDFFSASLLALSELLTPRIKPVIGVF